MPKLTYRFINDVFRGPVYGQHDIFTAESWRRCVRMHDLDLSRAIFAEEDGKPVGAIAFSQRGTEVWLSVMGVLPAYRKRGYGRYLFGSAVDAVRATGAQQIEFEVVQRNEHARRMYESFGFHIAGELYVWARKPVNVADHVRYERRPLGAIRRVARSPRTCWQRDPIAVSRGGDSALITTPGAYAFLARRDDRAIVLDAGASSNATAAELLAQLNECVPYDLTLLNEPSDSPLTQALHDAGWRIVERQYRYELRQEHDARV